MAQNPDTTSLGPVLILAPFSDDAYFLSEALREEASCRTCRDLPELVQRLEQPTAAVIAAEEAFEGQRIDELSSALKEQPPWSDIPLVLLTNDAAQLTAAPTDLLELFDNMDLTVLKRPVDNTVLVRSVRSCLRARRRQYELHDELVEQRLLTDTAPVLIARLDREERYRFVNRGYEEWFGIPREQIIGRTVRELLGEEAYARARPHIRRALAGETVEAVESANTYPAGGPHIVWVRIVPEPNGNGSAERLYVAVTDITKLKQAEEALLESEGRFQEMADGLPLLIWVHDASGEQELVNRTFCEFFGVTREEMTGDRWQTLVHPQDAEKYFNEFSACLRERRPFHAEVRVKRADGEWRWMESWGRPRFTPGGEFRGFIGTSADITERKKAERVLQRKSQQHALAKGREEERKRIARELHDDFVQRMAALSMQLDQLAPSSSAAAELSGQIESIKSALDEVTDDIDSLSRRLHPSMLDHLGLNAALEAECGNLSELKGFAVRFRADAIPAELPPQLALTLYRIVQESLRNVAQHAEAGKASVLLYMEGDTLHLEIKDDGKGFDLAQVRKRSNGLGLLCIEDRLDLFDGRLSIHSQPGNGTRLEAVVPHATG